MNGDLAVILNPGSGAVKSAKLDGVRRALAEHAPGARILEVRHGAELPEAAERVAQAGCATLAAAGGDGTVSAVASVAIRRGLTLGVLPLGTRNHFARDLDIPLDPAEAARTLAFGHTRRVDAAEVNGRTFVNNASLGVYPRIVRARGAHRQSGVGKWLAALWSVLAVLRRRPFLSVRIVAEQGDLVRLTPLVLVGNNEYRVSGLRPASRDSLDRGHLAVYVLNAPGRVSLLRLALAVLRRGAEVPELDLLSLREVTVETRRRGVQAAVDGELVTLTSPLRFRSLPGALRVIVPERAAA